MCKEAETNTTGLLNAKVYEANERSMILNFNNEQEGYAGGLTPFLDRNGDVIVDRVDN